jgi:hypothetical protein
MLESIVKSIENSFVQFSLGRLLYLIFLFFVITLALYIFDSSTGYTKFSKIDHQINSLEKLHKLKTNGLEKSPELYKIYESIIEKINDNETSIDFKITKEPLIKVLSSTIIIIFFIIYGLYGILKKNKESWSLFGGALMCFALLSVPSYFVPNISGSLKVTALVLFLSQLVFLVGITKYFNRK